jgi:hypothetical protein
LDVGLKNRDPNRDYSRGVSFKGIHIEQLIKLFPPLKNFTDVRIEKILAGIDKKRKQSMEEGLIAGKKRISFAVSIY